MWHSCRSSRAIIFSQILAVNDVFSHITGHPVNFSSLGVFWGKSTDKAGFLALPDRSPGHLMFIPSRPLVPCGVFVHMYMRVCVYVCVCVFVCRYHQSIHAYTHTHIVCARVLTFAYSCLQAQLKKLQLYMSRSIDAGFER